MADDKKPQTKPVVPVADAVLKTGTTTPETPAVKVLPEPERFDSCLEKLAAEFHAAIEAVAAKFSEEIKLLNEKLEKLMNPVFASWPSGIVMKADANPFVSGAEGGFATSEMTVTSKVFDVTCAACGPLNGVRAVNEKEACEKYKKHFGIINTPHPITAELKG